MCFFIYFGKPPHALKFLIRKKNWLKKETSLSVVIGCILSLLLVCLFRQQQQHIFMFSTFLYGRRIISVRMAPYLVGRVKREEVCCVC